MCELILQNIIYGSKWFPKTLSMVRGGFLKIIYGTKWFPKKMFLLYLHVVGKRVIYECPVEHDLVFWGRGAKLDVGCLGI